MFRDLPFGGSLRSELAYSTPPLLASESPPAGELGGFSIEDSLANVSTASVGLGRAPPYGLWHVASGDRHLRGTRARAVERVGRAGDSVAAQLRRRGAAGGRAGADAAAGPA